MNEWINEWMNEWMSEWIKEWINLQSMNDSGLVCNHCPLNKSNWILWKHTIILWKKSLAWCLVPSSLASARVPILLYQDTIRQVIVCALVGLHIAPDGFGRKCPLHVSGGVGSPLDRRRCRRWHKHRQLRRHADEEAFHQEKVEASLQRHGRYSQNAPLSFGQYDSVARSWITRSELSRWLTALLYQLLLF